MSKPVRQVRVPRDLLRDIQCALNDIPNTSFAGERWTSTYALAAELTRLTRGGAAADATPIPPPSSDP